MVLCVMCIPCFACSLADSSLHEGACHSASFGLVLHALPHDITHTMFPHVWKPLPLSQIYSSVLSLLTSLLTSPCTLSPLFPPPLASLLSAVSDLCQFAQELLATGPCRPEPWVAVALYCDYVGEKEKASQSDSPANQIHQPISSTSQSKQRPKMRLVFWAWCCHVVYLPRCVSLLSRRFSQHHILSLYPHFDRPHLASFSHPLFLHSHTKPFLSTHSLSVCLSASLYLSPCIPTLLACSSPQAISFLHKALSLDPRHQTAYLVKGLINQAVPNIQEAVAAYSTAYSIDRRNILASQAGLLTEHHIVTVKQTVCSTSLCECNCDHTVRSPHHNTSGRTIPITHPQDVCHR